MNYGILVDMMVDKGFFTDIEVYSDSQLMVTCPLHKGGLETTPSMGINLDKGAYNCFGCGEHGRLEDLVKHCIEGADLTEAEFGTQRNVKVVVPKAREYYNEVMHQKCRYKGMAFKCSKEEINSDPSVNGLKYLRYQRGIYLGMTRMFPIGGDENNVYFFTRNLCGNVVMYKSRNLISKMFRNVKGATKDDVLFGMYEYMNYSKVSWVVIVESEIDALSLWSIGIPALAIGGTAFTKEHVNTLKILGVRKVYLAMDKDKAGAKATAEMSYILTEEGMNFSNLKPALGNCKDINDMLKEGILKDWAFMNKLQLGGNIEAC